MRRRSQQNPTPRRQKATLCPETLSRSIDESRREIKKLKKQQSDIEHNIVQLRQTAHNLDAVSKKLVAQWAQACEVIVERERAKREKVVQEIPPQENDENKVAKEDAEKTADVESKSAAELMIGDYFVELDNVKKRLFEEEEDDDDEAENHRNAIDQSFQEWFIENSTTLW